MKYFYLLILSFIVGLTANAQVEIDWNESENLQKGVLLVPFDPVIYYNDATPIIAKNTGETHDEIMLYFREQLNLYLFNSLMDSCRIVSFHSDNTRQAQEDIGDLYSIISYELRVAMENAPDEGEEEEENYFQRKKKEKAAEKRNEEMSNYKTKMKDGELYGQRQKIDDTYLHIILHQNQILSEIGNRRDVDYFLFINQFEIKGNYGNPYMSGSSNNTRQLKVHFSLYNREGNLVHGSFGKNEIPFSLDDKEEIVNVYFPEVMRQIIRNLKFN